MLRLFSGALFAAIFFLLACQLPGGWHFRSNMLQAPSADSSQAAATTKTTPTAGYPPATPVIVTQMQL